MKINRILTEICQDADSENATLLLVGIATAIMLLMLIGDIVTDTKEANPLRIGSNAGRLYDHTDTQYFRTNACRCCV